MSEGYRYYARSMSSRSRKTRRRGGRFSLFLILLLLIAAGWGFWTTRDSHDLARLAPRGQAYVVHVHDFLGKREGIAASRLWSLLPEGHPARAAAAQLPDSFGMPDWVLNNVIGDFCLVSGDDTAGFSDPLLVTRMSRIGCLIERCHGFMPGIAEDEAGGLALRHVGEAGIYYAVRGRILALSPSRDALVRALTLTPGNARAGEELEAAKREAAPVTLAGRVRFQPGAEFAGQPLGDVASALDATVTVTETELQISCCAGLLPEWQTRLAGLLGEAKPVPLVVPPEGLVTLSADFGKDLATVWQRAGDAMGGGPPLGETLAGLAAGLENGEALGTVLAGLLGQAGPGLRLTWLGVDPYAIVPMPEFAMTADANRSAIETALAVLPGPADAPPWKSIPRYDAETQLAWLPLIGGPSIEPTLGFWGDSLLFSNSRTVAESLLRTSAPTDHLPQPGNLYVKIVPYPALQTLVDTAALLAAEGFVRGHTETSLRRVTAPWLGTASRIAETAALLAHEDGSLRLDFRLRLANP